MRSLPRPFLFLIILAAALPGVSRAQSGCGVQLARDQDMLPTFTATADKLSTAGGSSHIYVLGLWGIARGSLANPANPGNFSLANIGQRGSPPVNGGVIPTRGDCNQGGSVMAVAEAPDGSARPFLDWRPVVQCANSGLFGQVVRADGAGTLRYGQQINVSAIQAVPYPLAALYLTASGRYIAYFPTPSSGGLRLVDATVTTGSISTAAALSPFASFTGWPDPRALQAAHVTVGGISRPMLAGVTDSDGRIRLADLDPSTGVPTEVASVIPVSYVFSLALANVNGRLFVFTAEWGPGIRAYEYAGGTLTAMPQGIGGTFDRVLVKGGQFPALIAHRTAAADSYVDIYDTVWLTQGGPPRLAKSLLHRGSLDAFREKALEAVVRESAGTATAYIYRLRGTSPEMTLVTDPVNITCIAFDPVAPPLPTATATNLSALARPPAEAAINYYGDRWQISDASSTGVPLTQIEWDWNFVGSFQVDPGWSAALPNASFTDVNPAYFPCDPSAGGNVRTGASCRASLGLANPAAAGSYRFALRTRNANGWSVVPFVTEPVTFVAPQARVAGFSAGHVQVLSGGQLDARVSQGNVADALFQWTFSGGAGGAATGSLATVPPGVTGFALTVTYPGGYVSTLAGAVDQVDLLPDFSLGPNPVGISLSVTLTNQMQVGSATLDSVEYVVNQGPAPSPFSGPALAGSFHPLGGTAQITAPATPGSYNVHLEYNYTASGQSHSLVATKSITVLIPLAAGLTGPAFVARGTPASFFATASGGGGNYSYDWKPGESTLESYQPGASVYTHVYGTSGTYTVSLRVRDSVLATAFATHTIQVTASASHSFHTIAPCRVVDTRAAQAPALAAATTRTFSVAGVCGVPATAKAVAANVTVAGATSPGLLTVYAGGSALPLASTINYGGGGTRANNAILSLGTGGAVAVRCDQASGTTHFILDVSGYFE